MTKRINDVSQGARARTCPLSYLKSELAWTQAVIAIVETVIQADFNPRHQMNFDKIKNKCILEIKEASRKPSSTA